MEYKRTKLWYNFLVARHAKLLLLDADSEIEQEYSARQILEIDWPNPQDYHLHANSIFTSSNFSIHQSNEGPQLLLFHVLETWIPSWIHDVGDLFMHFGNLSFNRVLSILEKVLNMKSLVRPLIIL
ncbi:hypothetical protein CR513_12043, partial [Mucuna pruriens]